MAVMRVLLLAAALLVLDAAAGQRQQCGRSGFSPPAGVGAAFAEDAADFPWLVWISSREAGKLTCAGAVISDRWIISSATCVTTRASPTAYSAVLNPSAPSAPLEKIDIVRTVLHPKFEPRKNTIHDIALLEMSAPIPLSSGLEPICLPDEQQSAVLTDQALIVAGWGAPEFGGDFTLLKWAKMTVTDFAECKRNYSLTTGGSRYFVEDAFCAKLVDLPTGPFDCGLNAGDLGTVLMAERIENGVSRWHAAGLHVNAIGCGLPNFHDINVDLRQSTEWITSVISKK